MFVMDYSQAEQRHQTCASLLVYSFHNPISQPTALDSQGVG